ncbi:MAG: VirB3 family type IV secretion system protein [Rhodopila sp.]|jgi:type IV secretory pathway TrbD component
MASTPTFRSLTQPLLVAGGERAPMALVVGGALLSGVVAWFAWSITAACACTFLLTAGMTFLRSMAKRDPLMFEVAQRFYGFKKYYPARTSVYSKRGYWWVWTLAALAVLLIVWVIV